MSKSVLASIVLAMSLSAPVFSASAADQQKTVGDKVEAGYEKTKDVTKEAYEDVRDGTKKAYRKAKDETCELVNGKMECKAKKAKHKIQNTYDSAKDKANDPVRKTN